MSAHFSKFALNSYAMTSYFLSQLPAGYPISSVLQKSRAFRRLPPRLRELAALAKQWMIRQHPEHPAGIDAIEQWYDPQGNELDPETGHELTDEEIDAQWKPDPSLDQFFVTDLPDVEFADPATWEEPLPQPLFNDDDFPDVAQLKNDVASRGFKETADEYGMTLGDLMEAIG